MDAEQLKYYNNSLYYCNRIKEHDKKYFNEYIYLLKHHLKKGESILDVGCGTGQSTQYLAGAGFKATGVDGSRRYIELGKKVYRELELLATDVEELPFRDNTFDAIASFNTIEHFRDPKKSLGEMVRVVKKNGKLIILSPNLLSPKIALNAFFSDGMTFDGQKNKEQLLKLFGRNLFLLFRKGFKNKYDPIFRSPDFNLSYSDADATWLLNPLDLKYFFLNKGCRIESYQPQDHIHKTKKRMNLVLAKIFPSFMSLTRIVAVKE